MPTPTDTAIEETNQMQQQPVANPVVEPTIASSGAARDNVAVQGQQLGTYNQQLEQMKQTALGIQSNIQKLAEKEKADKAAADQQKQQQSIEKAALGMQEQEVDPYKKQVEDSVVQIDNDLKDYNNQLDQFSAGMDTALQLQLNGIKAAMEARRREMQDINRRLLATYQQGEIRGGSARYASEVSAGIISAEERNGAQRIADITAEEQAAIAAANQAYQDKKFTVLNTKMSAIKNARTQKMEAINQLQQMVVERNKQLLEEKKVQMEQEKAEREEEAKTIENISFLVGNQLTGDQEKDMDIIKDITKYYPVDATKLYSASLQSKQKNDMEIRKSYEGYAGEWQDELVSTGKTPDELSLDEWINLRHPEDQYKAEGAKLDILGKQLGIQKSQIDIQNAEADLYLKLQDNTANGLGIGELGKKFEEQNVLDFQTVTSAYETIKAITNRYGTTPELFKALDAEKMTDVDAESISKALARMQNPDVARMGGDTGGALDATSLAEKGRAALRRWFGGQQYLPDKVENAVSTAASLYKQRESHYDTETSGDGLSDDKAYEEYLKMQQ